MSARICESCEIAWPPTEQYRTGMGARMQRTVNEQCPVCGGATSYRHAAVPDDPDDRAAQANNVHARIARGAGEAEFDAYYAEYATRQLHDELVTWTA